MSFGAGNFGRMVELADGKNMVAPFVPGTFGKVNAEQIIASNPDTVIVAGGNWDAYVPCDARVGVGLGQTRLKPAQSWPH